MKPKKQTPQPQPQLDFEAEMYAYLGEYKGKLIKQKLGNRSIKQLCAILLVEWLRDRVSSGPF